MKTIGIQEALDMGLDFVDVRSPKEFSEDTVPGAVNIPLLDNEEREKVGITYKEEGSHQAKLLGLQLVAASLPSIVEEISKVSKPVVFCWRGGLRSGSVLTLLDIMGIEAYGLEGGYKSYRQYVLDYLESDEIKSRKFIMLHGLTGVGKTEILKELRAMGENVIDFEGLANHRGSVFGSFGLDPQPSQKAFESSIFNVLRKGKKDKPFYVECESRRVGRLLIPKRLFECIQEAEPVLVYDSIEGRVKRILKEYMAGAGIGLKDFEEAARHLKDRLGWRKVEELLTLFRQGEYSRVVEYLLLNYYDPLYGYPDKPCGEFVFSVRNGSAESAKSIKEFFDTKIGMGGGCLGGSGSKA